MKAALVLPFRQRLLPVQPSTGPGRLVAGSTKTSHQVSTSVDQQVLRAQHPLSTHSSPVSDGLAHLQRCTHYSATETCRQSASSNPACRVLWGRPLSSKCLQVPSSAFKYLPFGRPSSVFTASCPNPRRLDLASARLHVLSLDQGTVKLNTPSKSNQTRSDTSLPGFNSWILRH